jgi:hypothetical protein
VTEAPAPPSDEERLVRLLQQVVEEALRPLFEERWPDFAALLTVELERHMLEATRETDAQMPALLRQLVDEAIQPVKRRLDQIEARLFRRGI